MNFQLMLYCKDIAKSNSVDFDKANDKEKFVEQLAKKLGLPFHYLAACFYKGVHFVKGDIAICDESNPILKIERQLL